MKLRTAKLRTARISVKNYETIFPFIDACHGDRHGESDFEAHGAVFLPAAGYRFGTKLYSYGKRGSYCSATSSGSFHAWNIYFDDTHFGTSTSLTSRYNGQSVRLVTNSAELWYTSVTTGEVTDIDITAATANGEVTDDGGTTIDECGFCWGTDPSEELTVEGTHVTVTVTGIGTYSAGLTGLTQNTTYYVRAYVTNSEGTVYGDVVEFTTLPQPYDITATADPTEGGAVSGANTYYQDDECTLLATPADGYDFVNWTKDGGEVSTDAEYTFTVTEAGDYVAHFEEIPEEIPVPEGAINGKFSVNADGGQVFFSQGNLQYIGSAATPYWQFAEHQWDYLGDNGQGSDSQTIDCDLFGWGTSGYDHGAVCYQPWSTSNSASDYYAYGNNLRDLYNSTGQADWGYNAIRNGGNQENSGWRTLTREEWKYIFNECNTASGIRFAMGNVNGVDGVILLPDNWSASMYTLTGANDDYGYFLDNTISATDWTTLFKPTEQSSCPKQVVAMGLQ